MSTPTVAELPRIIDAVASWQRDGLPVQVHPGDLGWYQRFGATGLAAALRIWCREDEIVAVGFLDESELIRMAVAPSAADDEQVASRIVHDFTGELGDVLPAGRGIVEARYGPALRHMLKDRGWALDDPWTPLVRDLRQPVEPTALRVVQVGPDQAEERVRIHAAAFPGSSFTLERWRQMAEGYAYQQARCLIGYDQHGVGVAASTVWSAGEGRPGLIEPLGVHRDHRGQRHGVAITLGAAAALWEMGCSSALVATPASNTGAVATYRAAGFHSGADVRDFRRP
ncbi:GNAT family N-acetyltransferase [Parenemella sanctibonifatiensis]|uniref:GNAT family N-acetyltransferase n=1 Tax=Parenemella sanctibonifatiensis TaxID=2016505 RepID=A0A255EHP2_9ACTN|nr:GNAT family N-acetyltransferase [Parenemella sanctibonifatiensis]OYN87643.1 GNAT family N-acetyltransferase [Parenemella sanctibonifatiensis]